MIKADVNCLLGNWPFKKLYKNKFSDLIEVHARNGIAWGYVSSLNSIFYNDPFEGDEELHEIIKDTGYRHILTVNPKLPSCAVDIKKGIELYNIKGVKVFPTFHGYSLDDRDFTGLCELLEKYKLPLFLNLRMVDERLDYIFKPAILGVEEIRNFIKNSSHNATILLNIRYHEILELKDELNSSGNIFLDTSGLKDGLFVIEKLLEIIPSDKILYGSLHPLFCLKSTLLTVEKAEIGLEDKEKILGGNLNQIW